MYSPKVSKELVPLLYQLSKRQGLLMTRLIDKMLREAIEKYRLEPERGNEDRPPSARVPTYAR